MHVCVGGGGAAMRPRKSNTKIEGVGEKMNKTFEYGWDEKKSKDRKIRSINIIHAAQESSHRNHFRSTERKRAAFEPSTNSPNAHRRASCTHNASPLQGTAFFLPPYETHLRHRKKERKKEERNKHVVC